MTTAEGNAQMVFSFKIPKRYPTRSTLQYRSATISSVTNASNSNYCGEPSRTFLTLKGTLLLRLPRKKCALTHMSVSNVFLVEIVIMSTETSSSLYCFSLTHSSNAFPMFHVSHISFCFPLSQTTNGKYWTEYPKGAVPFSNVIIVWKK